jgi:hypothetical protein
VLRLTDKDDSIDREGEEMKTDTELNEKEIQARGFSGEALRV